MKPREAVEVTNLAEALETLGRLTAEVEALRRELCELRAEVTELRRALYGNNGRGLKTAVELIQQWVETVEREQHNIRARRWQLRLATYGWLVAVLIAVGSWFFK